jgi:hypothetical protein
LHFADQSGRLDQKSARAGANSGYGGAATSRNAVEPEDCAAAKTSFAAHLGPLANVD